MFQRWFQSNWAVYMDNATSRRDYRVQLRGNRSVWLFAFYLGILISIAMFVYSETSGLTNISISQAQSQLQQFYMVVMVLLGSLITLVAPALTATTVVAERQRKSLDLIFSAPTSPKYFLVGKMIGSYRFTWMLLILSLPVTAACVVLGGASWSDVVVAYLLLSVQALLLTSVALMMSTLAQKPVSALCWTYALVITYVIATSAMGAFATASIMMGGSGSGREAFFGGCLNPFAVSFTANTYSVVWGHEVPNWILATLFCLAICRICLLSAASLLAPYGGKELPSLRVHGVIYTFLLVLYIGYMMPAIPSLSMGGSSGAVTMHENSSNLGKMLFSYLSPLLIFVPLFTCFGFDAERRYWPNGWFSFKRAFDGSPAGALPYILMIIGGAALGAGGGFWWSSGSMPDFTYWCYVAMATGFWYFFWAVGRLTSSFFLGLKSARGMQFAVYALIVIVPVPFLTAIASANQQANFDEIWELYILRPIFASGSDRYIQALIYGLIMFVVGTVLERIAEAKITKRAIPQRINDGQPLAAA